VLKYFQAGTRPPIKSDPSGTVYVKLVTRPQYKDEQNFLEAEMWVDANTFLPVKLVTKNRNKDITTANFSKVQVNEKVDDKLFLIDEKDKRDWQPIIRPWKED
jgi:outer membrane lipoprotein-sorting protein